MDSRRFWDRESFIELASSLHNGKYNYSMFEYDGKNKKGTIICPEHGEFEQTPAVHARKERPSGCPLCGNKKRRLKFDYFVKKATEIHGDKYRYSEKDFNGSHEKTKIFCKKCNKWFEQIAENHISKSKPTGCPICAKENGKQKLTKKYGQLIDDFRRVHGDKYKYDENSYKKTTKKMRIFCERCEKWFEQTPHKHISGQGCPICRKSSMERQVELLLADKNVVFYTQKTFPWLKYKNNMYLDFFLVNENIAIECQGEQHFKPTDFSHRKDEKETIERFKMQKERDNAKLKLCQEHGIKVEYIGYKDNITERLSNILREIC